MQNKIYLPGGPENQTALEDQSRIDAGTALEAPVVATARVHLPSTEPLACGHSRRDGSLALDLLHWWEATLYEMRQRSPSSSDTPLHRAPGVSLRRGQRGLVDYRSESLRLPLRERLRGGKQIEGLNEGGIAARVVAARVVTYSPLRR
jgi:hypothetical protein